jgi:hypothetical protein
MIQQQWQYNTVALEGQPELDKLKLDVVGQHGWELVAVSNGIAYLKQPIPEQPAVTWQTYEQGAIEVYHPEVMSNERS